MTKKKTKKLILHIGRGKTGTSSLQRYLTQQRSDLAKMGICYPESGIEGRLAHHEIARLCQHSTVDFTNQLVRLRRKFENEAAPYDRIIVSSERFQRIAFADKLSIFFRRRFSNLRSAGLPDLFSNYETTNFFREEAYDIHAICYLREFLDYACSSYSQKVQNSNLCCGLDAYCRKTFRRSLARFCAFWTAFSDQTTFLLFDRGRFHRNDIVEDFFHQIDAPLPLPPPDYDQNPSVSGNLLGFKLLLNSYGLHEPSMYASFRALAKSNPAFSGRFYVSDAQATELRTKYAFYNSYLGSIVGDVPLRMFRSGQPVPNRATWSRDLEQFLTTSGLSHLKRYKEIACATPDVVEDIVRVRAPRVWYS